VVERGQLRILRHHYRLDLDIELAEDVITVFVLAVRCHSYPDALGYGELFERVVRTWRPELEDCPEAAGKEAR
jgi:hypothetical protein